MSFDISGLLKPEEKHFVVEYNSEITVTLRMVSRAQMSDILKAATTTTTRFDRTTHQKTTDSDFDHLLFGELLGKAAIVDWSGIEVAGQPYPATPESIAVLMRGWSDFAKYVADLCSDLERLDAEEKELLRKNSSSTSEPEQTTLQ